jgi:hypothetical protein
MKSKTDRLRKRAAHARGYPGLACRSANATASYQKSLARVSARLLRTLVWKRKMLERAVPTGGGSDTKKATQCDWRKDILINFVTYFSQKCICKIQLNCENSQLINLKFSVKPVGSLQPD